jgi:hypothetical protein
MLARMRLVLALAASCASLVVACGRGGPSRLDGHWHGVRAEGVAGEPQEAAANAFATGMELDIKGDSITVSTAKDRQSGRFRIVREDKAILVLTTEKDGPDEPQTFTFVDTKTMKWAVLEGKTIVFVKD